MKVLPWLAVVFSCAFSVEVQAFTTLSSNQLVYVNVDHAPVGAYSTFAYGYTNDQCGLGTSSSAIPYQGGGGGLIVALSGNSGLQAMPFALSAASISSTATFFPAASVQRTLTPCTDQWSIPGAGLAFTHYTPAWPMPDINTATLVEKKRFFLPATWMVFTVTNNTAQSEDFYFGLPVTVAAQSFANGAYQGFVAGEATLAVQTGSCDLLSGGSLTAALNGVTNGFAFHLSVPAGQTRSLTVVVAYYRSAIVDTRISASYYYTTLFSYIDDVIDAAFAELPDAQIRCQQLAGAMQNSGINVYRRFLASDALHSYQCNTMCLIDTNNVVYWREIEGIYENINTFDLTVDHAFYDMVMCPWALRNVLDAMSGASNGGIGYTFNHPLYNEASGNQVSTNGFSFHHDMGNNDGGLVSDNPTNDPTGYESSYSYMGQEQLDNWLLCAGQYWTHTGDNVWLTNNSALLQTCLNSMLLRDDTNAATRDGITTYLNRLGTSAYEITTYDALDASLQSPLDSGYTALKNWGAYVALQAMFTQLGNANATVAQNQAALCAQSVVNSYNPALGYIPAELNGSNTAAILPILEGLACVQWMGLTNATDMQSGPYATMLQTLRQHTTNVLVPGKCLDATTGGWKLTSANNNTWQSKVYIAQYAAENVLGITGSNVDGAVDQIHATFQMQEAPYQGWSDQLQSTGSVIAQGSLHYPRGVTSALWWLTPTNNPVFPVPSSAPAAPTGLTGISGNNEAILVWNASAQTIGYNVKRGTSNGGPYFPVAGGVTGVSYVDSGVTNDVTNYYVVTATNQIGESVPSAEVAVIPQLQQNAPLIAYAVNSGGGAASPFMADAYFSGGTTYSTTSAIDTSAVTNPAPQAVYQTERYGDINYDFPDLALGASYKVRLHFAELYWNGPGHRLFNVFINGTQVLTNYDIFADAGAEYKATIKEFTATPNSSGYLIIQYVNGSADNAKSSGIEIQPLPATPTGLTATAGDGEVTLNWAASFGATGYDVQRSATNGGPYAFIATNLAALSFTNTGLPDGTTWYFVVLAKNPAGESADSVPVSAQPVSLSPPQLKFGISGGQMQLDWPTDHTGWELQVQTNPPSAGLGANWTTITNSSATNLIPLLINRANGSVFFRLAYP